METKSGGRVPPGIARIPRRLRAAAAGAVVLLALTAGCSEWDRYWEKDPSPLAPDPIPDTTPPSVSVRSPGGPDSASATPVSGASYEVTVEADDDVGVVSVDLSIDDQPAVALAGPPWIATWNTVPLEEASVHRLRAVARDAAGNTAESDPVFGQVFNAGPQVVIVEPVHGALVRGSLDIAVEFQGEVPDIENVEFFASVWSIALVTSPPWSTTLDTNALPPGEHYLLAKARTVLGSIGVTPPVRIHVNNGTPDVSVLFPSPGFSVASRGQLYLHAAAVDEEQGALPSDAITWASDVDGTLGTGSELLRADLTAGPHTITATGTNAWGTPGAASVDVNVLAEPTYAFCQDVLWEVFEKGFCTFCHIPSSSEYPNSLLDLTSYATTMAGGKTTIYKCVAPCRPESSFIYNKVIAATPWLGDHMPNEPSFPELSPQLKEQLRVWILEGAPPDVLEPCP